MNLLHARHPEQDGPDLNEFEIQAVINQTALAIAERFGVGVGGRRVAPAEPFVPADTSRRLKNACGLANGIQHRYGHHHYEKHMVTALFGAPAKALRQPGPNGELTERQQALIIGLERFCAAKGIRVENDLHTLHHEKLQLNNIDAAEIAATRAEIGTFADESWRHLHFADKDSLQRFEVANTLAPLLDADAVLDYARNHYGVESPSAESNAEFVDDDDVNGWIEG